MIANSISAQIPNHNSCSLGISFPWWYIYIYWLNRCGWFECSKIHLNTPVISQIPTVRNVKIMYIFAPGVSKTFLYSHTVNKVCFSFYLHFKHSKLQKEKILSLDICLLTLQFKTANCLKYIFFDNQNVFVVRHFNKNVSFESKNLFFRHYTQFNELSNVFNYFSLILISTLQKRSWHSRERWLQQFPFLKKYNFRSFNFITLKL